MRKSLLKWMCCFVAVVGMTFALSACSDDDDDKGPGNIEDIVGTWEIVTYEYIEKEEGKVVEKDDDAGFTEFVLNSDKTAKWYGSSNYTWSYSGGKLRFTDKDDKTDYEDYKVIELTATSLVFEYKENYKEDGVSYEDYEKYTCKKKKTE